MSIESEFTHRGFRIRLKYRGGVGKSTVYHYFILTDHGPVFGTATTIFEAKHKAVSMINDWTSGDWTHTTGAVQCTTGDRADQRSVSSIRRDEAEAETASTTRSA